MPTAANTAYAVPQTKIGLALEATRGTPVAPTYQIPVKSPKLKPDLTLIADQTLQGSMVQTYNEIPGLRYDSHGWDSYPYLDSFPLFVCGEFGSTDGLTAAPASTTLAAAAAAGASSVSLTASVAAGSWVVIGSGLTQESHKVTAVTGTGPYSATLDFALRFAQASGATVTGLTGHQFSLLNNAGSGNQPPSMTISDYDGEEWRQFAAAQLDKLTIKGNATGLVDYTCSFFANPFTNPAAPSLSMTSTPAVPSWTTSFMIGGTLLDYVEEWEIDFARGVKPIPAFTGTQEYFLYFAGPMAASVKMTVIEQSGAPELTKYLNGTVDSLDIYVQDVTAGNVLHLHSTDSVFTTGALDRSKEEVTAQLDVELLPSAADATAGGVSPCTVTIANGVATAYH